MNTRGDSTSENSIAGPSSNEILSDILTTIDKIVDRQLDNEELSRRREVLKARVNSETQCDTTLDLDRFKGYRRGCPEDTDEVTDLAQASNNKESIIAAAEPGCKETLSKNRDVAQAYEETALERAASTVSDVWINAGRIDLASQTARNDATPDSAASRPWHKPHWFSGIRNKPRSFVSALLTGARHTVASVPVALLACAGALWALGADQFANLPSAFWTMALLAVLVDTRPYVIRSHRASSIILPSTCFSFGILLAWGFVPAIAAQLTAMVVSGVRMWRSAPRALYLALQNSVALGSAAAVVVLFESRVDAISYSLVLLVATSAAIWIVARQGLDMAVGQKPRWQRRWMLEVSTSAALLLLGPVVLVAAQIWTALVPLVLIALHAVGRAVHLANENQQVALIDADTTLRARTTRSTHRPPSSGTVRPTQHRARDRS